MIGELVSEDMVRRELRYMAEAHDQGVVVRMSTNSSFGISVRDASDRTCLVAMLDGGRRRITEVAVQPLGIVPPEVYRELFDHVRQADISIAGVEGKCAVVRDAAGTPHSIFDMPEELELDAGFYFHGGYDIALPRRLRTSSDFILIGARITSMCETIEIGGDADFSECEFETFPERTVFHRNLVVSKSTIKKLPRGIVVGRWLKMAGTEIETVPASARIGVGIDAENSRLRIIPPGFAATGDLLISGTRIRRLSGVQIGGNMFIERMAGIEVGDDCEIAGNIYTDDAEISLPARFSQKVFIRNAFGYERRKAQATA